MAEGALPLQLRRQQEELARWRKLETSTTSAARMRPDSATRRRPPASAPRREVAELQALVMERRELMARQRAARGEGAQRPAPNARDASRDSSPALRVPPPPPPEDDYDYATGGEPLTRAPSSPTPRPMTPEPPTRPATARDSTISTAADTRLAARGRERADALELQLAQKDAALGRTRIAAERSAQLAAQAQAEAARLRTELDDARELRIAAMGEAREWRVTSESSSEQAAAAATRLRSLEEDLSAARAAAMRSADVAKQASSAAEETLARSFSAEERRELKSALEAAQRRADELTSQSGSAQAKLLVRAESAEAGANAARHELGVREQRLKEMESEHAGEVMRLRQAHAEALAEGRAQAAADTGVAVSAARDETAAALRAEHAEALAAAERGVRSLARAESLAAFEEREGHLKAEHAASEAASRARIQELEGAAAHARGFAQEVKAGRDAEVREAMQQAENRVREANATAAAERARATASRDSESDISRRLATVQAAAERDASRAALLEGELKTAREAAAGAAAERNAAIEEARVAREAAATEAVASAGARAAAHAAEAAAKAAAGTAVAAGAQARAEVSEAAAVAAEKGQATVELELEIEAMRTELRKADVRVIEAERRASAAESRANNAERRAASTPPTQSAPPRESLLPRGTEGGGSSPSQVAGNLGEQRRLERLLTDTRRELETMQSLVAAARLRSLLRLHRGAALARAWRSWSFMALGVIADVDVEAYASYRARTLAPPPPPAQTPPPPPTLPPAPPPAPPTAANGEVLMHTQKEYDAALAAVRAEMQVAIASAKSSSDDVAAAAVAQAVSEERARADSAAAARAASSEAAAAAAAAAAAESTRRTERAAMLAELAQIDTVVEQLAAAAPKLVSDARAAVESAVTSAAEANAAAQSVAATSMYAAARAPAVDVSDNSASPLNVGRRSLEAMMAEAADDAPPPAAAVSPTPMSVRSVAPSPVLVSSPPPPSPLQVARQQSDDTIRAALLDSSEAVASMEIQLQAALSAAAHASSDLSELEEASVLAAREAYQRGVDEQAAALEEALSATRRAERRLASADEAVGVLERRISARDDADAAEANATALKEGMRAATSIADTHAADAAMVMAAEAAEEAAQAAEEAERRASAAADERMHSELDDLEAALEQIAKVAPAVGAGAKLAVQLSKSGGSGGQTVVTASASSAAKGKGAAHGGSAAESDDVRKELREVRKTLQAREVEVASLKTSLKAARAGANAARGKGAASSPRRQSSSGGFDLGALLGGGVDEAAAVATEMELGEMEKVISQLEGALERRGAWRKPPPDAAIGAGPSRSLKVSVSSPGRLTRGGSGVTGGVEEPPSPVGFLKDLWEQGSRAVADAVGPKPPDATPRGGARATSPLAKGKGKPADLNAALDVDVPKERRKEEGDLADLAVKGRSLLAASKSRQGEMRRAADALAEDVRLARTAGGEAARGLSVRLGEAELEVATLKRYLREAESVPDSPAASYPQLGNSPTGGAAVVTVGVPLSAGPMSGAGAAALERARARGQDPPMDVEPSMDDWASGDEIEVDDDDDDDPLGV